MLLTILTVCVVSGALLAGAVWGIYGKLPEKWEGFLVALAGGALIISAVLELVEPATHRVMIWSALAVVFAGAAVFTVLDYLVKKKWGSNSGGGLLAAITLDGIPENLAMGVALIGAGPLQVAALAGSILLSNLPEAAGGAKGMLSDNISKAKAIGLWAATAVLLSAAALAGYFFLALVSKDILSLIRCFAAGAIVGSLATEVFPKAFKEDRYMTGVATAVGLCIALALDHLGG